MKALLAVLTLILPASALAQDSISAPTVSTTPAASPTSTQAPVTLEQIVVHSPPVGIAVKEITGEEAQEVRDTGNLGPALDKQSGLETQGEGMGKAWNTLSIRGQSFRETVVLVDGQRVPESFNLGTIPTENIERVEVIEGPQALAYGRTRWAESSTSSPASRRKLPAGFWPAVEISIPTSSKPKCPLSGTRASRPP